MINHSTPRTDDVKFLLPPEADEQPAGGIQWDGDVYASTIVITPTYNERENLPLLVEQVLAIDPRLRMLVVDDGSPDGTGEIAEELGRQTGRVDVIHRQGKLGMGSAYIAGYRHALEHGYRHVVHMDCDFSHRPEDLPSILESLCEADVVVGSRNVPGGETENWSPLRGILSKGGSLYARTLLRLPLRDCTGGFKAFRRCALEALDLDRLHANGFGFQIEENFALHRAGMQFAEVPIIFPDRTRGQSKMSLRIILEAAVMVLLLALGIRKAPLKPPPAQPASEPAIPV